ncbi:MAG: hypothetical protein JXR77_06590, partial [Lentisphaeria bacterium]|nr:hypothetical protein [Lentisphaeria bacterium]
MKRILLKCLKWTGIAVIVLIVLHAALLLVSGLVLRKEYIELRKAGRPMTAEEIIPPEVPDAENGALLYTSAILLLKSENAGNDSLLRRLGELGKDVGGKDDASREAREEFS